MAWPMIEWVLDTHFAHLRVEPATLELIAERGVHAFRTEDVAARASVNKTTIYRRWPSKAPTSRCARVVRRRWRKRARSWRAPSTPSPS